MTENGEVISDLPAFALTDAHIWVTYDPTSLLNEMLALFGDCLAFAFSDSRDPEIPGIHTARLTTFGFAADTLFSLTYGKKPQHTVWQPSRMFSSPRIAVDLIPNEHHELMKFADDIRSWCKEQDLPLKSTLPAIGSSLLRDKRFWPDDRGRVPRATNENIRKYLPGVHHESHAKPISKIPTAIALDQKRAYHRVTQDTPLPNGTNLYARGYFNDPEGAPNIWAPIGSLLYQRVGSQPGLLAVMATCRPKRKHEFRPPVCNIPGRNIRYVWSNELDQCIRHGMKVEGIVASWTSEDADDGMPRYGRWAESEIDKANEYRRTWLKPTLHSLYGLLGARPRDILIGRSHGKGEPKTYTMRGYTYDVKETILSDNAPSTTNVAALGVLQSAIRARSLALAHEYGANVLHVHADGLHLEAVQLEFLPDGWTVEPVTNLCYLDKVSWTSDERDVLPGRDYEQRAELRAKLLAQIAPAKKSA